MLTPCKINLYCTDQPWRNLVPKTSKAENLDKQIRELNMGIKKLSASPSKYDKAIKKIMEESRQSLLKVKINKMQDLQNQKNKLVLKENIKKQQPKNSYPTIKTIGFIVISIIMLLTNKKITRFIPKDSKTLAKIMATLGLTYGLIKLKQQSNPSQNIPIRPAAVTTTPKNNYKTIKNSEQHISNRS